MLLLLAIPLPILLLENHWNRGCFWSEDTSLKSRTHLCSCIQRATQAIMWDSQIWLPTVFSMPSKALSEASQGFVGTRKTVRRSKAVWIISLRVRGDLEASKPVRFQVTHLVFLHCHKWSAGQHGGYLPVLNRNGGQIASLGILLRAVLNSLRAPPFAPFSKTKC